MTPAEHYAEAETLIGLIEETLAEGSLDAGVQANVACMGILANIHAQLATVRTPEMARETWDMIQQAPKPGFHPLPKSEVP